MAGNITLSSIPIMQLWTKIEKKVQQFILKLKKQIVINVFVDCAKILF